MSVLPFLSDIPECTPQTCGLYGECIEKRGGGTACQSELKYTGADCRTNIDDCWRGQCLNGGTCVDGVAAFVCICPEGFAGTLCNTKVSP